MQPPQIDNQARLQALLAPQENVQEALVVDLSHDLRFSPSSLVLTDTRLLALDGTTSAPAAQSWPLRPDLQLRMSDHAGGGTLGLHDGQAPGPVAFYPAAPGPGAAAATALCRPVRGPGHRPVARGANPHPHALLPRLRPNPAPR